MNIKRKKKNNFRIYLLWTYVLLLMSGGPALSNELTSQKRVLDNGLTVLVTEMPSSTVVSVYALIKTGSATEGKFLGTGISHFLEHMLFKGTHGRGVGEVAARIQSVGGRINASTGKDYTIYTITVPVTHFDTALDILSDMVMNATIDPEEVELERNVILGEMRMRRDDPDRILSDLVYSYAYIRHPYRHLIIGYEPLFADVTAGDINEYYRATYVPNNMIISVAGNVDSSGILAKVREAFKDFERKPEIVRNLPAEPVQNAPRYYETEYPTDLTRLTMAYASMPLLDKDLYALDVLAKILGDGRSSRLYLDIYKEQSLVHSISVSNYTPADRGLFSIDCLLDVGHLDAVIDGIKGHIEAIKGSGVKNEELEKAKRQVRSEYVYHHQRSSSIAFAQALDEAYTGDHLFSRKYVEAIGGVTGDDIRRVADKYLVDSGLTTVVLRPEEDRGQAEPKTDSTKESDIVKHVLDNGLTVLLREDDAFPMVTVRVTANGGVRQEPEDLNGLSEMMASTWIKGTKNRSADEIAEKTESLGMDLSSFSGRNSFGLSLQLLKEDLPFAFNLIKELVMNPRFAPEEIDRVKTSMKASIRQRDDDIFQATGHVLREVLFKSHPFRLEQDGTQETVEAIGREDIVDFYKRHTMAPNVVLSVFGDIEAGDTLNDIRNLFGDLSGTPLTLKTHREEPPRETRKQEYRMDKEQAMVMFGFHGAPLSHEDVYGLDVLTSVLGSSFSGRLFNHIREELGGAYTLGGNYIPGPDAGFIYFYVLTTDDRADKVTDIVKQEIKALQKQNVGEDELKAIKEYLKGTFKQSNETGGALSFTASLDELYGLGFDRYLHYDEAIERVTAADLKRLAKEYLDLNKAAIVVTRPDDNGSRKDG